MDVRDWQALSASTMTENVDGVAVGVAQDEAPDAPRLVCERVGAVALGSREGRPVGVVGVPIGDVFVGSAPDGSW